MRGLNRSLTIVIVLLLITTSFTMVLIIDGRNRQDPSEIVWRNEYDQYTIRSTWDHFIDDNKNILYTPASESAMSRAGTMMAIDLENDEILWTHTYHHYFIPSVSGTEDLLISGGRHGEVIAVDAETGEKVWHQEFHTKNENENHVYSTHVHDDTVFTGSNEGRVVAAEVGSGEELWRHTYHTDGVISNRYGDIIYSACNDGYLIATDAETGEKLRSYSYHEDRVSELYIEEGIIYSASRDGMTAYDIEKEEELWSHKHHLEGYLSIHVEEDIVYSGGVEGVVMALEAENGEKIWDHDYHQSSYVHSIQVLDGTIYSMGHNDGILAVEHEGGLITGISRSLSAFGGFLSTYVLSPFQEYWLISLLILAGVISGIILLLQNDKETKSSKPRRKNF